MTDQIDFRDVLPRGYLSISQINMYHRCPYQYYRRYVQKEVSPPGVALVVGSSGHAGIETDMIHKMDNDGQLAPEEMLTDVVSNTFDEKSVEVEDWEDNDPGKTKDQTIAMVKNHHKYQSPKFDPVSVEKEIRVNILTPYGVVPVLGYADLETMDTVIDHKFVKRHKSKRDADFDIQLSFYAFALQKQKVAFNSVKKRNYPGRNDIKLLESNRTARDFHWLVELIGDTAYAITQEVYPRCKPDEWWCDERFCGWWDMCRGRKFDNNLIHIDIPTEIATTPATSVQPDILLV